MNAVNDKHSLNLPDLKICFAAKNACETEILICDNGDNQFVMIAKFLVMLSMSNT